jgi:hypothetical protein
MRKLFYLVPVAIGVGALIYSTYFTPESGRPFIVRAVAAHGGEASLARTRTGTFKGIGTKSDAHGFSSRISWEETYQQPDRLRRVFQKAAQGQVTTHTFVYRDGKAWVRIDDDEPTVSETGPGFNESIACPLGHLLDLYRNKAALKPLGEKFVDGRFTMGVEVNTSDWENVELYFDTNTHLLTMIRGRSTDAKGAELTRERVFSNYKTVDGIQVPGIVQLYINKQLMDELVVQEARFLERIDDKVFEKP